MDAALGKKDLGDAARAAAYFLSRICARAAATARGIPAERIYAFGIAFQDNQVLIEKASC